MARSDAELIDAFRNAADRDALDELVQRHLPRVRGMAFQMTLSDSEADDLAQEVFLRVVRGLAKFSGKSQFSTWLYRITMNTTYSHLDRKQRAKVDFGVEAPEPPAKHESGPEQTTLQGEFEEQVEEALAQLTPKLRSAIVLTTLQGLNPQEAAEVEECSTSTLYWRIHEARKQLKQKLANYHERLRS